MCMLLFFHKYLFNYLICIFYLIQIIVCNKYGILENGISRPYNMLHLDQYSTQKIFLTNKTTLYSTIARHFYCIKIANDRNNNVENDVNNDSAIRTF